MHSLAVEDNFAVIGLVNASYYFDQRGFTRSIFPKQGVDFTRSQRKKSLAKPRRSRSAW
jgi:hypothetical protein